MASEAQSTPKPLGRWHRWWLRQFREAHARKAPGRHSGGIFASGWEGLPQGYALVGLLDRGLIAYDMGFEGGGALLHITEEGLRA